MLQTKQIDFGHTDRRTDLVTLSLLELLIAAKKWGIMGRVPCEGSLPKMKSSTTQNVKYFEMMRGVKVGIDHYPNTPS